MTDAVTVPVLQTSSPYERVRFLSHLLGASVAEIANELFLDAAIKSGLDQFAPEAAALLGDRKAGYLVRVNLYRESANGAIRSEAPLLSPIGIGLEPLDALANSYVTATLGPRRAGTSAARYFWCTSDREGLRITCSSEVLSERLEADARIEARRRHVSGQLFASEQEQGALLAQRAEAWQSIYKQKSQSLKQQHEQLKIDGLNRRFSESQDRFNKAFRRFANATNQLARAQREAAFIGKINAVLDLLRAGMAAYSEIRADSAADSSSRIAWERRQMEIMSGARIQAHGEMNEALPQMRQLDVELRNEWEQLGSPANGMEWVPVEIPELQ